MLPTDPPYFYQPWSPKHSFFFFCLNYSLFFEDVFDMMNLLGAERGWGGGGHLLMVQLSLLVLLLRPQLHKQSNM